MAEFPAMMLWTDAYLADTTHLRVEEHGAYLLLLMAAWRSKTGALADDDVFLARVCRCTPERWRTKFRPVLAPFFTVADGQWTQKRLLKEREHLKNIREKRVAAAHAKHLKDKETAPAHAGANGVQSTTTLTTDKKEKGDSPLKPPRAKAAVGSRISPDWKPSDQDRGYARGKGFTDARIDRLAENFVNYWIGVPGRAGLKLDWSATWRNRVLQVLEHGGAAGPNSGSGGGRKSYHQLVTESLEDDSEGHEALFGLPRPAEILRPGRAHYDA